MFINNHNININNINNDYNPHPLEKGKKKRTADTLHGKENPPSHLSPLTHSGKQVHKVKEQHGINCPRMNR